MHPTLLEIGSFHLPTYGVLLALGFVVGLGVARRLAKRAGIDPAETQEVATWVVLGGLAGSRLLFVALSWDQFAARPWEALYVWQGGVVWYGAVLGGIAVLLLVLRRRTIPLWDLADVLAPAISLGHAFGRVGCFTAGCCWGTPTELPWAVTFHGGLCANPGVPLHPTQLYEASAELVIFAGLLALWARRRFAGQIFLTYLLVYSLLRVLLETLRGDLARGLFFGGRVSTSQLLSAVIFLGAGVLLVRRRHRALARS